MKMLYVNEKNTTSVCMVYAWMLNENKEKSFTQFPTFTDERGDSFCRELEKDKDFISWARNPWTDELNFTEEEQIAFKNTIMRQILSNHS